jgi:hypothetical protein
MYTWRSLNWEMETIKKSQMGILEIKKYSIESEKLIG